MRVAVQATTFHEETPGLVLELACKTCGHITMFAPEFLGLGNLDAIRPVH
jgi:hypothetical protein